MKKITIILFSLLICFNNFAQPVVDFYDDCIEFDNNILNQKSLVNSENGFWLPTKGTFRMLVIFVNIIYDVTQNPNIVNPNWPVTNIEGINNFPMKNYFDEVFDVNNTLPRQGFFTRFMSECSHDKLVMLADFTTMEIKESRIRASYFTKEVINYINNYVYPSTNTNSGLQAYYGHNSITNYDNATCGTNSSGNPPTLTSNNKIDYVAFLVLNPTKELLGISSGTGYTSNGGVGTNLKLSNGTFTIECYTVSGVSNGHLKDGAAILVHEFAHSLLGGNVFHTSGGNHLGSNNVATFLFSQKGYGLFSADNAFRSCNAYDRWRLGWRYSGNGFHKIAANGVNSDIENFTGTKTFYLRDFVKYGDAIRVKLPYKDSEEAFNQYIWLENHQLERNGKLDGFNYHFPPPSCIPLGTPGIYSFIQVGRDVLEGESGVVYFAEAKDNLRIISAEGNSNIEYRGTNKDCKYSINRPTFEYLGPNPLSGAHTKTEAIITTNHNLPNLQYFSDFSSISNKIKNGVLYNQLLVVGDVEDAFVSGRVMDISSNPPPINAYTHYARYYSPNNYFKVNNQHDNRKKYLTGLSIKMNYAYTLSDGTEVFKVDICWDEYDVKENVYWAGDIVLKENLNLLSNKTITFEQNLTAYQTNRDPISGVFAPPTLFTCEDNSKFVQQSNSHVIAKEKSKILLKSGSKYTISEGADLTIKSGCTLEVEDCATLEIKGQLIVENGANIIFQPNAVILLQDLSQIVYPGNVQLLIYPYVWINPIINSNITISQPIIFNNNIVVHTGATLTLTSLMKMGVNCKITIHPGGKLIVDGGTLTNSCPGQMWRGIFVAGNAYQPQTAQYQGIIELKNGAVIENARKAIGTYGLTPTGDVDWSTTGGIIYANNATFKNNCRSVEFMEYPKPGLGLIPQSTSYFKNCTFTVDDYNLFATNNTGLFNQISMWAVSGVKINGCRFENKITHLPDRKSAIYTIDGGYTVDEHCSSHYNANCVCNNTPDSSVFTGFHSAIASAYSGKPYVIKVDRSKFENNYYGIVLSGLSNTLLYNLDLSLGANCTGIYLDDCTGYKVEINEIQGDGSSTGILINNAGTDENKIGRNTIKNTRNGIHVIAPQNNRGPLATGLQLLSNEFTNNTNDIHVGLYGIVRLSQGSPSCSADNLFGTTATYNYLVSNMNQLVNYYYDRTVLRKEPVYRSRSVSIFSAPSCSYSTSWCGGGVINGKSGVASSESQLAQYRELNKQYAEMMRIFYEKGYDKILNDYYNGTVENEELLQEAMQYQEEILAVTEIMAEISNEALINLKTDSIINLYQIRDWYDEIYNLSAKYSLAEIYYQLGKFDEGFKTLTLIPEMYKLSENEAIEHLNYVSLFTFKNKVRESGRVIAELNEDEIAQLLYFAKASNGLSSLMAKGILCFFYEICIEDEMIRELDDEIMRRLDDETINEGGDNSYGLTVLRSYGLEIFPNPGKDYITVVSEVDNCLFELIDTFGKVQNSVKLQQGSNNINTTSLHQGIYIYRVITGNKTVTGKWIKIN